MTNSLSLDIQNAYDTAWRDAILLKLYKNFNAPFSLIKIIQNLLSKTFSGLRCNFHIHKAFATTTRVVQGGVLSPFSTEFSFMI